MSKLEVTMQNIAREVKILFKNSPVSERNAPKHLVAAWQLEKAAEAIRARVKKHTKPPVSPPTA